MKIGRIIGIIIGIGLLISVRVYEHHFNDELLAFFDGDFQNKTIPNIDFWTTTYTILLRFLLNGIASLAIIYFAFWDKKLVYFCLVLYLIFGLVLTAIFWICIYIPTSNEIIFFVRRLLIQPILILVLLPAIYFLQNKNKHAK